MQYTLSKLNGNDRSIIRAVFIELGFCSKLNCAYPTILQKYNVGRSCCRKAVFIVTQKQFAVGTASKNTCNMWVLTIQSYCYVHLECI